MIAYQGFYLNLYFTLTSFSSFVYMCICDKILIVAILNENPIHFL